MTRTYESRNSCMVPLATEGWSFSTDVTASKVFSILKAELFPGGLNQPETRRIKQYLNALKCFTTKKASFDSCYGLFVTINCSSYRPLNFVSRNYLRLSSNAVPQTWMELFEAGIVFCYKSWAISLSWYSRAYRTWASWMNEVRLKVGIAVIITGVRQKGIIADSSLV